MNILEFKNVSVNYGDKCVFSNVNLQVEKGSFNYIMGKSGVGKTTLLRLFYNSNISFDGKIVFMDRNLGEISAYEHQKLKQKIGVAFQNFYLLDHLNALDNVTLPLRIEGVDYLEANKRGLDLLEFIGLVECMRLYPYQLSGGEKQRLVIARALIGKPALFLADEPTGNLDDENIVLMMRLFEAINQQGVTIMLATHNKDIVDNFTHEVIAIDNSRVYTGKLLKKLKVI